MLYKHFAVTTKIGHRSWIHLLLKSSKREEDNWENSNCSKETFHYTNAEKDLTDALRYFNESAHSFVGDINFLQLECFDVNTDLNHKQLTDTVIEILGKPDLKEYILRAAHLRKFLG